MTIAEVVTDRDSLTVRAEADFDASVEEVWKLWENPRLLEKWWGPPDYPAIVTEHDLVPGGVVRYHMTGPDGENYGGYWIVKVVEPPHRLVIEDMFTDDEGVPQPEMPTSTMEISITEQDESTHMTVVGSYSSIAALEKVIAMGMEEGLRASMGQIDALLETVGA